MRRMTAAILTCVALAIATPRAEALTVRDIIELSRAGLGEDVLLALIDVNGGIYAIDPVTLKALKEARVSERVIVALVRSGRERAIVPEPQPAVEPAVVEPPPPQVVVIEHEGYNEPRVREVAVPVPVFVPVRVRSRRDIDDHHSRVSRPAPKPAEPVFWGWGGKLRPDAWKPTTAADVQKDARVPKEPQKK